MSEPAPGLATSLLLSLQEFAEPVIDAFDSPEAMEFLFYQLGWRVSLDEAAAAALSSVLPIGVSGARLEQLTQSIRAAMDGGGSPDPADVAQLAGVAADLLGNLGGFAPSAATALPAPLDHPATWEDAAEGLFDFLLERFLRRAHPLPYLIALISGALRYDDVPAAPPWRIAHRRAVLDWDQVHALLEDPLTAIAHAYHWNDPAAPLDHVRLLDSLDQVLRAIGLSTDVVMPVVHLASGLPADVVSAIRTDVDGLRVTLLAGVVLSGLASYEVGLDLLPAAGDGGAVPTGLVLRPRLLGSLSAPVPLGRSFGLTFDVDASVGDALGVALYPDGARLTGGDASIGASVSIAALGTDPYYLIGSAGTARIELHSPSIMASFAESGGDAEFRIALSAGTGTAAPGARVVVTMGGADSFVQDSMGSNDLSFSFSPELIWSSATGFAFNGRPTPQFDIPLSITVGTFRLQNAHIALQSAPATTSPAGFALAVGLDVAGSIGPVDIVVHGVGFALDITPYSRADLQALPPGADRPLLGNIDLGLGFVSPTGAGLSVDVAGVLTGGGFLMHDVSTGLYAGVLELSLHEALTLKAIALISTVMPDGSAGYSMLVLITAEDFEPIPLGMGFDLLGIGGLIGIHRTFDDEALRAGLKSDTLASVLFPTDPVRNAAAVIRSLTTVFPAQRGSYLLGLMAKIGRTAPSITMDLAVIFEFGARRRLIVLGRISALLPTPQEDLIRINLDAVGVIDFDQGTVALDATLVDSKLAHKYILSGGMALRANFGSGPSPGFLLAIGGFHPHFTPPAGTPSLDRVAIALSSGNNPRMSCESYFALTSNTIQFGARAQLYAAAYGFSVEGDIGYDVLVQRNPFGFIADFHASIALKHGSTNLFKVDVDGVVQGPRPLRISGSASFSICWCDFSVSFDKTLIDGEPPPLPPGLDPAIELAAALIDPSNWISQRPANRAPGFTLRKRAPGAALLVDPLGVLTVRQGVVPLDSDRDIEMFGDAPNSGARRFVVTASLDGHDQHLDPLLDLFAPAQFFALSDDQKISGPSFERMQAGFSIGVSASVIDDAEIVAAQLDFQTLVIEDLTQPPVPAPAPYQPTPGRLGAILTMGALAQAGSRTSGRARFRNPRTDAAVTVNAPSWSVVAMVDDAAAAPGTTPAPTWSGARGAADALNGATSRDIADGWQLAAVFGGAS